MESFQGDLMKNISIFALLVALVATSGMVLAKSSDYSNGSKANGRKGKMTRDEKRVAQDEKWAEGQGPVSDESEVWYTGSSSNGRGRGNCNKGSCNVTRPTNKCKTRTEAPCPTAPVCRKMVPVEAPADKHEHVTYSYTCPVGYNEVARN